MAFFGTASADWSSWKDGIKDKVGKATAAAEVAAHSLQDNVKVQVNALGDVQHLTATAEAAAAGALGAAHLLRAQADSTMTSVGSATGLAAGYISDVKGNIANVVSALADLGIKFEMHEVTCNNEGVCSGSFYLGRADCGEKCLYPLESQVGVAGTGFNTQLVLKLGVDGSALIDKSMSIAKWGGSNVKVRHSAVAKEYLEPCCAPLPMLIGNAKVCFKVKSHACVCFACVCFAGVWHVYLCVRALTLSLMACSAALGHRCPTCSIRRAG